MATNHFELSDFELESLAKAFLNEINKFYNSEEGQKMYLEWQKEEDKKDQK